MRGYLTIKSEVLNDSPVGPIQLYCDTQNNQKTISIVTGPSGMDIDNLYLYMKVSGSGIPTGPTAPVTYIRNIVDDPINGPQFDLCKLDSSDPSSFSDVNATGNNSSTLLTFSKYTDVNEHAFVIPIRITGPNAAERYTTSIKIYRDGSIKTEDSENKYIDPVTHKLIPIKKTVLARTGKPVPTRGTGAALTPSSYIYTRIEVLYNPLQADVIGYSEIDYIQG